ncbi:hypothetical protein ACTXT7_013990, partial [Hymenolepis weldensis]
MGCNRSQYVANFPQAKIPGHLVKLDTCKPITSASVISILNELISTRAVPENLVEDSSAQYDSRQSSAGNTAM